MNEPLFTVDAAIVSAESTIAFNDAVARDDDGEAIITIRIGYGTMCRWLLYYLSQCCIALRGAVGNG